MTRTQQRWLVCQAWMQLARYDVIHALFGFRGITTWLTRQQARTRCPGSHEDRAICDAVLTASCLYWKSVLCLQRSVCTAALLRKRGVPARCVIGYRPVPFLSHAWVEIDGRVVNDSAAYQQRLVILYTV
jgi:hypothetical protein